MIFLALMYSSGPAPRMCIVVLLCYRQRCTGSPGGSPFLAHSRLHAHTHRHQHTATCRAMPETDSRQHPIHLDTEMGDAASCAQLGSSVTNFVTCHSSENRQEAHQQGSDSCYHTQMACALRQGGSKANAANSCHSCSQSRQAGDISSRHQQHRCNAHAMVSGPHRQCELSQWDMFACGSRQHRYSSRQKRQTPHGQLCSQQLVLQRGLQQSSRQLQRSLCASCRPVRLCTIAAI